MSFTKILEELNLEIASLKRKRETLKLLLGEGKVSQGTFNVLDGIAAEIETVAVNLKEKIEESVKFWEAMASEEARVLESLLVDLRFKNLVGDIDEETWRSMSATIELGVRSIGVLTNKTVKTIKNHVNLKANTSLKKRKNHVSSGLSLGRENRAPNERACRLPGSLSEPKSPDGSHCMNPWKPNCRRTDIKLSIYYNGRFLPICNECWKEISEKNIEWTG
ncbi:MAG: hypothetical protein QW702_03100 [Candidatus Bathyarchaeia archaeon]